MKRWECRERARQVLARETGYVTKPHAGRLRVALAFPNTYFVGMSNLGFQTVYRSSTPRRRRLRARLPARRSRTLAELEPTRHAPRHARVADAGRRLRRHRVLGLVRVGLHERRDACCAWPACRSTPRSASAAPAGRHRRRRHLRQPRAAGAVRRRHRRRRGRGARPRRWSRRCAAADRDERPAAAARAARASTSRRSTTSRYDGWRPHRGDRAASRAPARRRSCARRRSRPPSGSIRRTRRSSRPTPSSGRASSSRWCAAAPTCAGSAGPATTTCRCGRSRPIASSSSPRPRARTRTRVGLVSIALCDHPEIERILAGLLEHGLLDQPGVAADGRPDRTIVRGCARAASAR